MTPFCRDTHFTQTPPPRRPRPAAAGRQSSTTRRTPNPKRQTPNAKRQTFLLHAFRQELREMSENRDQGRDQEQCHYPPGGWPREVQAVAKAESFLDEDG
jgi:hypothetical protein